MIQIKCNSCGKEFALTRNKCPFCGDSVKTSCKFYCGTCGNEIKLGNEVCDKCREKPRKIVIEKSNGKRITTDFDTEDEIVVEISDDENYMKKLLKKYVIIPHFIYWTIPILLGFYMAVSNPLSLCSLDSNCVNSDPAGLEGFVVIIALWLEYLWPGLIVLLYLFFKYYSLSKKNK